MRAPFRTYPGKGLSQDILVNANRTVLEHLETASVTRGLRGACPPNTVERLTRLSALELETDCMALNLEVVEKRACLGMLRGDRCFTCKARERSAEDSVVLRMETVLWLL